MHVQIGGYRGLNGIEELAELNRAVAPVAPTDDLAGLGFESGEQGRSAMPNVVMRAPLRLAWPHGQQRPGAVQCLDLGLLVHTQDQRSIRRVEVQAHNITDFFDKERVRRQLEGIRPMGLQSEGPPYAVDGAMAQARASGHRARAPVGRIRWSSLKGHAYDSLHVSIGGPAGCTRSRLVQQSIHSPLQEPRPPLPHRRLRHPQLFSHSSVCLSISASEYHPRPLGQRLRRFRSARPRSQCLPFFTGECQRQSRSARAAHVHPPQMSRQKDTRYCNSYATNFRDRTLGVVICDGRNVTD